MHRSSGNRKERAMSETPETETPETETLEGWFAEGTATLGDRIAAARRAAGMSEAECARRLGVLADTLGAWEADQGEPRANRLQMLAGVLGVSLRWLITGQGEGPDAARAGVGPDARAALGELRGLAAEVGRLSERIARSEQRLRRLIGQAA
jgi:transcriptional regulator with XRE-family HTH domain